MKEKQTDKIRMSLRKLKNPSATNAEIADTFEHLYGYRPTSQAIYETLGKESLRKLKNFSAHEMLEAKTSCKRIFDGDFSRFRDCLDAVESYVKV